MAFIALDLAVPWRFETQDESPVHPMQLGLFAMALSVSRAWNKQGSGN